VANSLNLEASILRATVQRTAQEKEKKEKKGKKKKASVQKFSRANKPRMANTHVTICRGGAGRKRKGGEREKAHRQP